MKIKAVKTFNDGWAKCLRKKGEVFEAPEAPVKYWQGLKLVEALETKPEWPKHIGGGVYELSNGDRVKGKEAAIKAQDEINAQVDIDDADIDDPSGE